MNVGLNRRVVYSVDAPVHYGNDNTLEDFSYRYMLPLLIRGQAMM